MLPPTAAYSFKLLRVASCNLPHSMLVWKELEMSISCQHRSPDMQSLTPTSIDEGSKAEPARQDSKVKQESLFTAHRWPHLRAGLQAHRT